MRFTQSILALFVAAAAGAAHAQSTAGAGSVIVVPLVAQTGSYASEVTVRNPNSVPITLSVEYYEANNLPAPGSRPCDDLTVAAFESRPFSLVAQCELGAGSHFGMLVLRDASVQKTNYFFAYSRTQTPGGNGFSVEGFPIGAFSGADADVVGLKRNAAAPVYQTNCFVAALGEPVNWQMVLRDGTSNNLIGAASGTLEPYEQHRIFDVFDKAGVPAGDYANVRASFTVVNASPKPALVSFCTLQESTFFGADFRIAKSVDALSDGQRRVACLGQDSCGTVSSTQPENIVDPLMKNVYSMLVTQPDYVRCDIVSPRASELQMQLRQWGDPFASPHVAGGANETAFYAFTGERGAVNGGTATRWFIDVAARDSDASVPIAFGITCRSGNGSEMPWFRGTVAKDF